MKTQKKTLGRVVASLLALTLATGLVPVSSLAFAKDAAGEIINEQVSLNAEGDEAPAESADASDAAASSADNAANSAEAEASDANATEQPAEAPAAEAPAPISAPAAGYTNSAADRISADVPVNGTNTVVGNVQYEGLSYRINADGQTVTLTGLGSTAPKGDLTIPAQIAAGNQLYKVTNIGTSKILGGGVRHFCAF